MLNTKYFIVANQNQKVAQRNSNALGNAWFVKEAQLVANADEELSALSTINTAEKAVIDTRYSDLILLTLPLIALLVFNLQIIKPII